jgi:hypothetical protein
MKVFNMFQQPFRKGSEPENRAQEVHADLLADLAKLVSVWPTLPEHIKTAIFALTGAALIRNKRKRRVKLHW